VHEKRSAAGFADPLKRLENIGLTFGGGCFFGDGVNVSGGPARFILTRFEETPLQISYRDERQVDYAKEPL
jgi:hypothetical protein